MIRNERSTPRLLPGLFQALSWLRQSLPPADRPALVLIPAVVPTRRRRTAGNDAERGRRHRYRPD
jgi:hypothetical protein